MTQPRCQQPVGLPFLENSTVDENPTLRTEDQAFDNILHQLGTMTQTDGLPPLRLKELLAACMSAGWLAGEVIREVVAENGDLGLVNKAADKYDPQTVADRRSQQRMIHALRTLWPHLQIVGEEGELEQPEPRDAVHADVQNLLADVPFTISSDELAGDLDPQELVLWMDPLDGTKKFAEKKYDEVSVLLGIAYKKRPIAGVMHLPFHGGNNGETLWGGPSIGVFRSVHRPGQLSGIHSRQYRPALLYPQRALRIMTSGTNCALVNEALDALKPELVKYGGATGTMAMSVLTGECDAFFRFRNATKRWDICAIEPLLEALGGRLVDKYGRVYEYDPREDETDYDNAHGLIVTLDATTHELMLHTMDEIHVMRTLDGGMMSTSWLEANVFHGKRVLQRRVERRSILKGKQSVVAKLVVEIQGNDKTPAAATTEEKHVFLKRYVKEELPPRGERHWTRDLASYRTEARFYASVYPHMNDHSIGVIKPLAVQFRKDAHRQETGDGFLVMLENVLSSRKSQLVAADCLSSDDTRHALDYLAVLHASAIKSRSLMDQVRTFLWPSGVWWSFEKRGVEELSNAPRVWRGVLRAFEGDLSQQGMEIDDRLRNLGDRMVTHAAYISEQLFGEPSEAYAPFKTLVHGDFKTANMFFDRETRHVTAFDWQWAGVGLGALDVANLLNTSVGMDALEHEEELLRFYYRRLQAELRGTQPNDEDLEKSYPFEAFQRHVEFATLEYARVLIANFWEDMTPQRCTEEDAPKTNWGLGYRSVPHVVRIIRKLHNGLAIVAQEQKLS